MLATQVDYWKLQETKRHDYVSEYIDQQNADTNARNASVNESNAATNARNADTNAKNADTNVKNMLVNKQNAQTNARNADINARNADINAENAKSRAIEAWASYSQAKTADRRQQVDERLGTINAQSQSLQSQASWKQAEIAAARQAVDAWVSANQVGLLKAQEKTEYSKQSELKASAALKTEQKGKTAAEKDKLTAEKEKVEKESAYQDIVNSWGNLYEGSKAFGNYYSAYNTALHNAVYEETGMDEAKAGIKKDESVAERNSLEPWLNFAAKLSQSMSNSGSSSDIWGQTTMW